MVGRQAELALSGELVRSARRSNGAVLLLAGEPGIGKTRLATECVAEAVAAGFLAITGECLGVLGEASVEAPFGPLVTALSELRAAGIPRDVAVAARDWTSPEAGGGGLEPTLQRSSAMIGVLHQVARWRSTVLLVEDVHWADRSTLTALELLSRRVGEHRLLVIVTMRTGVAGDTEGSLRATALRRNQAVVAMQLNRLPEGDIASIAAGARPDLREPDRRADLRAVVELADGVPHAAIELARAGARQDGSAAATSIGAGYLARLRATTAPIRAVIGAVAASGTSAPHDLVSTLWRRTVRPPVGAHGAQGTGSTAVDDELDAALRFALDEHLLEATADGYRFHHALNRDVAYHDLLPGTRRRHHGDIATFLEASLLPNATSALGRAGVAAQVAAHRVAAGELTAAVPAGVAAARAAHDGHAHPEAAEHYVRALQLWATLPADPAPLRGRRPQIAAEAAEALHACGDVRAAIEMLDRRAVPPADRVGRAVLAAAEIWLRLDERELDRAAAACDEVLHLLEGDDQQDRLPHDAQHHDQAHRTGARQDLRSQALAGLSMVLYSQGHHDSARAVAQDALEAAAGRTGAGLAHALLSTAALSLSTAPATALSLLDQALAIAGPADLTAALRRHAHLRRVTLTMSGRSDQAATLLLDELHEARRDGGVGIDSVQILLVQAVEALTHAGRWEEATDLAEEGLHSGPRLQYEFFLLGFLLDVQACRAGTPGAAPIASRLRRLIAAGEPFPPLGHLFGAALTAVSVLLARIDGDVAAARAAVDVGWADIDALAVPSTFGGPACLPALLEALRAETDARRLGHPLDAAGLARLGEALDRARQNDLDRVEHAFAALAHAERELTIRPAAPDDVEAWRGLLREVESAGHASMLALARSRAGEVALEAGDPEQAADWLSSAAELCAALGATALGRAVVHTARGGGLRPEGWRGHAAARVRSPTTGSRPSRTPASTSALTPRELEVLELLAEGLSNRVIGRRLGITEKTAGVHVSNLMAKLGARSRGGAVAAARRTGALRDP